MDIVNLVYFNLFWFPVASVLKNKNMQHVCFSKTRKQITSFWTQILADEQAKLVQSTPMFISDKAKYLCVAISTDADIINSIPDH